MKLLFPSLNKYVAAAILASLLSANATVPVFAEESLPAPTTSKTVASEQTLPVDPQNDTVNETTTENAAETIQKPTDDQPVAEQNTPIQNGVAVPDIGENPTGIDHSAEFKPIQNEFLKEGEGIPGSEINYPSERSLSRNEWKEILQLEKDVRILERERQAFFKNRIKEKEEKEKAFASAFKERQQYSIIFNPEDYSTKTMNANGEMVTFRAYEHLVYVRKPYEPESQMLSIYIPEPYLKGESINGFTAETAPIFMPNGVAGYLPGTIVEPQEESRHGGANSALYALSNGYVVVSPAIRGRSLKGTNGYETGKAPAFIVDYKAAVRFVRRNRKAKRIPAGDTEKIISSGTSSGGALSALLGATGNAKDYEPYLKELDAAKERDDIFASMAYCPITNLENSDMAYEWMFHDANEYYSQEQPTASVTVGEENTAFSDTIVPAKASKKPKKIPFTPEQKEISAELKENFSNYLNYTWLKDSLGNRPTLSPDGNGLFREYIESLYLASAQDAIDTGDKKVLKTPWLTFSNGMAVHMDFPKYVKAVKRIKGIPAFDAFDMSTGENNEFGTYDIANKHFTRYSLEHSQLVTVPKSEEEKVLALEKARQYSLAFPVEKRQLRKANLEEQMEKDKLDSSQYMADWQIIKMMNPMYYIGNPEVQVAPNWRIRHGSLDRDTALAIPAILALRLKTDGKAVDFKVPWGYGHDGDYDLPELFAWADRICKIKDKADAILREEELKKKSEAEDLDSEGEVRTEKSTASSESNSISEIPKESEVTTDLTGETAKTEQNTVPAEGAITSETPKESERITDLTGETVKIEQNSASTEGTIISETPKESEGTADLAEDTTDVKESSESDAKETNI